MKSHRLFLLVFFVALSVNNALWASQAYPGWMEITQPDNSVVELRQMGDEYYHYWINRDGQEVVQNEEGFWVVAPEQLTPTQRYARRMANPRIASSAPEKASSLPSRILVIIVNFSDKSVCRNHQFFADMLNKDDSLSVREYFKQSSDGNYQPQFDVFGPVTLDSAMAYYGANKDNGDDIRPGYMVVEACKKADAMGCNFANYDENGDGKVDNVNIIFAGYSEASGAPATTIWPHKWDIYSANRLSLTLDGKKIYSYSCSNELRGTSGTNSAGIGTFCHEFSHILGMPDYYDTSSGKANDAKTPGYWSLMDCGNYNSNSQRPPLYSVFDKCYMGWAKVPSLLAKDAGVTMTMPVGTAYARQITGTTSAKSYTSTDTVYYIENRQQSGYFDLGLPGHGMLIWRVIYKSPWSTPNSTAGEVRYTIVSATGGDPNDGSKRDPYPGYNSVTSKTLLPGCVFSQITESSGNISFYFNGGGTTYNHTWMANGTQFTTTTSRSSLSLPTSSPSACSANKQFYGWTRQTRMKQDGSDLVLAKAYDEVKANTTFYAVYKTTASPARYSFQCSDQTYKTVANAKAVIVQGQDIEIGGQVVNTPGVYPYDTIKTIYGDSLLAVNLSWADLNQTIVYKAPAKLAEVTGTSSTYGLHTDKFGQTIMEHYFSNGIGVIAFDNNLTTVGQYAFFGCRKGLKNELTSVQIPNTVTTIGTNAFSNCWEITTLDLPDGLKKIESNAFYKCQSMVNFVLPDGVDTIADNAFQYCIKLQHITLSEGLKLIGKNVLYGCSVLVDITSRSLKPAASYSTTFSGITPANLVLYVWPSKVATYRNTTYWKAFTNIQPIDCGTTATIHLTADTICQGDSVLWKGKYYKQTTIQADTTTTDKYGCDTVINRLELTVNPTYWYREEATIFRGETYHWQSRTYTQSTKDTVYLSTIHGCDSIRTLNLVVDGCANPAVTYLTQDTIVQGDSLEWRGTYYKEQGVYAETTHNEYYCDTIIYILDLTVVQPIPTGVPVPASNDSNPPARKLIFHDRLLIFRNGKTYNAFGQEL